MCKVRVIPVTNTKRVFALYGFQSWFFFTLVKKLE